MNILNLSLNELKLVAKNRNINDYKSRLKDKLLKTTDNNKRDRESLFKSKKEETTKSLYQPTRKSLFKLKRGKIKKILNKPTKKESF